MTTVNLAFSNFDPEVAGWNTVLGADSTGQKVADLIDSTGASTGLSLWVTTAFTGQISSLSLATADAHGIPEEALEQYWYAGSGPAFEIRGFVPGQSGTISLLGDGGNASRDSDYIINGGAPVRYDANGGEPFNAPVSIAFTADGSGVIEVSGAPVNTYWYINAGVLNYTAASSATITNLDTDNSVTTYQQANASGVSGFGGPITSGSFGGEAVTIIDGDWEANSGVVSLRVPGNLATGTYDLVLSDGTDSATSSGVTFTQTHPRPALYGLVDSNSILTGQKITEGTRFRFVTTFSNGTLNLSAGDADQWANEIGDYYTPDTGFTGDDVAVLERIYDDATTVQYSVTIRVGDNGTIIVVSSRRIGTRPSIRSAIRSAVSPSITGN
jgi:hypothetical protein